MQTGLGESAVLRDWHQDAVARYNVTCDYGAVIRELLDPKKRFPFQVSSISGKSVQHANCFAASGVHTGMHLAQFVLCGLLWGLVKTLLEPQDKWTASLVTDAQRPPQQPGKPPCYSLHRTPNL